MVIAVVSDTHLPRGSRRLPEGCVDRMRTADAILHAGDICAAQVLAEIESLGPPVRAVRGNVDCAELRERLPEALEFEVDGAHIAMVHDAGPARGRLARLRHRFPSADAVVFGHSHLPLLEEADSFQIFNPGSPTERRRAPARTMGVARVEDGTVAFELIALH